MCYDGKEIPPRAESGMTRDPFTRRSKESEPWVEADILLWDRIGGREYLNIMLDATNFESYYNRMDTGFLNKGESERRSIKEYICAQFTYRDLRGRASVLRYEQYLEKEIRVNDQSYSEIVNKEYANICTFYANPVLNFLDNIKDSVIFQRDDKRIILCWGKEDQVLRFPVNFLSSSDIIETVEKVTGRALL